MLAEDLEEGVARWGSTLELLELPARGFGGWRLAFSSHLLSGRLSLAR